VSRLFHSGKRLQKIREIQGYDLDELADSLEIKSSTLKHWEKEGIPEEFIKKCIYYFEVSPNIFTEEVQTKNELEQLVRNNLFELKHNNEIIRLRLDENKEKQASLLDLSNLNLKSIPTEIFEFSWLIELNLSDNQLKALPNQIILLNQLEKLNLNDNLFLFISGILNSIYSLKTLTYQGNPLNLQPELQNKKVSLESYKNYFIHYNITFIIIENFTKETLNKFYKKIEAITPIIIETPETFKKNSANYQKISSIIYFIGDNEKQQITSLFPKIIHPLIFLLNNKTENLEHFDKWAKKQYPTQQALFQCADNLDTFIEIFKDFQQKIIYQNSLPHIKLNTLKLKNIGVYKNLEIKFNTHLTVLIGLNGAGKTTILKAISLAILGVEKSTISAVKTADLLRIKGQQETTIDWKKEGYIYLSININGKEHHNKITLSYNKDTEKVDIKGDCFDVLFHTNGYLKNIILGIGEQRYTTLNQELYQAETDIKEPKIKDLLPLINGEQQTCMTSFTQWLSNLALQSLKNTKNSQQKIDISFQIFSALMQEDIKFKELTQVEPLELWIEHQNPKQVIPLRLASQGYQAVMGWVGYIIQRMFEAYNQTLQPLNQPAIIIIDEIDQLLHIKWQRKIITVLGDLFFPNTQWIITTHSPMVVMNLDQKQVIQLHEVNGQLIAESNQVDLWSWQYGDIIRCLFDIPTEKPKEQENLLRQSLKEIENLPNKQQEYDKLTTRLEKVQQSKAFVDEIYAEQQKLHQREQELVTLIQKLKQDSGL